jgi:hypothetical protein
MRAVMVLVVMGVLLVLCGCEKHIKEVRAGNKRVVAFTPVR